MSRSASEFSETEPAGGDRRRAMRIDMSLPVRLRTGDGMPLSSELTNVSRTGFRSRSPVKLKPGTRVFLHMEGYGPRRARVAWQIGEEIGCRLTQALSPAQLAELLARCEPVAIAAE